jgi:hypothetical protein
VPDLMAFCTCKNSSALYSETLNLPSRDTAVRSSDVRKSTGAILSIAPSLSLKFSIARCKSFALGSARNFTALRIGPTRFCMRTDLTPG